MRKNVICIAHETGSGGPELAALVADTLGYRCVDEDILVRAARDEGLSVEELRDAERRRSFLTRVVESLGTAPVGTYGMPIAPVPTPPSPRRDDLLAHIRHTIAEVADTGDVVIVAHAASYALADRDAVLRVLVVGTPERRAERLVSDRGVDEQAAPKSISEHDDARAAYLKTVYGIKRELPSHYDLVLNTDRVDPEVLADAVCTAASGR